MTDTIFNETKSTDQTDVSGTVFNATEPTANDPLATLVGEGKKYADVSALAKSRLAADEHITKLETELSELRNNAIASLTREEISNEIKALTSNNTSRLQDVPAPTAQPQAQTEGGNEEVNVSQLVKQEMATERSRREQDANELTCSEAIKTRYGADTVIKTLETKARELGVTVNDLREDARRSPNKLLALFGISNQSNGQTNVSVESDTNTNSTNFSGTQTLKVGSKAYFENMRKTNPKEYRRPATQQAILKANADGLYFA